MIKIVEGNILQATEDIIGHQVNCKGVMGAGLAKQIKNKYPDVFARYKETCEDNANRNRLLGSAQFIDVPGNKVIVNIFSQLDYGTHKKQTDYNALKLGLESIKYSVTNEYCTLCGKSVALPYNIGCGLAGGDWNIVYKIIEKVFENYDVTLYKFK